MAKQYIYTEVDGRRLKLSNLSKIIYPSIEVTKAEIIQYYISVQDYILDMIRSRPLTLIRYPDGIDGERFYAKDKPKWSPDWIESMRLPDSDDTNEYLMASNPAGLVWLANLAALELHPMLSTAAKPNCPDHWIIDLDPSPNVSFDDLKDLAFELLEYLQSYDYKVLIKTSGGKGFHLVMPIKPKWTYEELIVSIKKLMKHFIRTVNSNCTLQVHKNKRKDKILLDIYRNHRGNTAVAAYSLRGKIGAPISTPIRWEDLPNIQSAQDYHIKNIAHYIEKHGHIWKDWRKDPASLHDKKSSIPVKNTPSEKLERYDQKRNFDLTTEPKAEIQYGLDDQFVVQLHDASRLHYDLRLELGGVLLSWAIPKGLPTQRNVKRLAIQTEDHPVKYLDFEGHIPDGTYGAGDMWIFYRGRYKMIKKSKKKYEFELSAKALKARYVLYHTGENHWIIELKSDAKPAMTAQNIKAMLANSSTKLPTGKKYIYEVKWDGIRTLLYKEGDTIRVVSRNGNDLTDKFPELTEHLKSIKVEGAILDGELVCLDPQGRPKFDQIISRMHTQGAESISRAAKRKPVFAYLFDLIYLDGRDLTKLPLDLRQSWLKAIIDPGVYRISERFEDGKALFEAARDSQLEGVMVKLRTSPYTPGKRSNHWIKVKFRKEQVAYIIGYTKGQGDRAKLFGALHLAVKEEKKWRYMGKVGTGYDMDYMKVLWNKLQEIRKTRKYIESKIEEEANTTWIEPLLQCQIQYASLSANGTYREPVFQKLIPPTSQDEKTN